MMQHDIVTLIEEGPCLYKGKGADREVIIDAEARLNLTFADDFCLFLEKCGFALALGQEIIRFGESPDLIEVTAEESSRTAGAQSEWYVVEKVNIDGAVIWQDRMGAIYQTIPNGEPIVVAYLLAEYLSS